MAGAFVFCTVIVSVKEAVWLAQSVAAHVQSIVSLQGVALTFGVKIAAKTSPQESVAVTTGAVGTSEEH